MKKRLTGLLAAATMTVGAVMVVAGPAYAAEAVCSVGAHPMGHVSEGAISVTNQGAFLRGADGHVLRYTSFSYAGICGPVNEDLGGRFYNYPAVADSGSSDMVVVRGTDNHLYAKTGTPGHRSAWRSIGGITGFAPAVVGGPQRDSYRVYVTGADHRLYVKAYDGGQWSRWMSQGGYLTTGPGGSTTASTTGDTVAAGGRDHAIYELFGIVASYSVAAPGGHWFSMGGRTYSSPSYVNADGQTSLLARGADDQVYYQTTITAGSRWRSLGGKTLSAVSGEALAKGGLTFFVEGTDHHAYVRDVGGFSLVGKGRGSWGRA